MTIEQLIKRRKKLGIDRKKMSSFMGYSYVWMFAIERKKEKISQTFYEKYTKVLDEYEKMLNKIKEL